MTLSKSAYYGDLFFPKNVLFDGGTGLTEGWDGSDGPSKGILNFYSDILNR